MILPTPKEIADELLNNAFLTEDQANAIAADVYQPLKDKIEQIENAVIAICASCDLSKDIKDAACDALNGNDS